MMIPPILRGSRAAFVFLTRIPVGGFPYTPEDWRWAPGYFPFVGAFLGFLMALVYWATRSAGAFSAAALTVAVGMLLTGAFHEDGLADTADALGGAFDRERVLVILKDSRIGAFGAAALTSVLLLRVGLLARLGHEAPLVLVVTQCAARTTPVWLMAAMPYVTHDDASRSRRVARAQPAQAALATLWPLCLLGGLGFSHHLKGSIIAVLVTAAVTAMLLCGWRFHVRMGGLTGDFLGATEQVTECAMLLGWALSTPLL